LNTHLNAEGKINVHKQHFLINTCTNVQGCEMVGEQPERSK